MEKREREESEKLKPDGVRRLFIIFIISRFSSVMLCFDPCNAAAPPFSPSLASQGTQRRREIRLDEIRADDMVA
jgi:hypothetical protein